MEILVEILVSLVAGAVGGILVVVWERFQFSAEQSWRETQRSLTFVLDKIRERLGRSLPRCSECLATDPECIDFEVDPIENPRTGDIVNGIPGFVYLCRQCGHTWRELPKDEE